MWFYHKMTANLVFEVQIDAIVGFCLARGVSYHPSKVLMIFKLNKTIFVDTLNQSFLIGRIRFRLSLILFS